MTKKASNPPLPSNPSKKTQVQNSVNPPTVSELKPKITPPPPPKKK